MNSWQVVWPAIPGLHDPHPGHCRFLTKRGAIAFGNRMSNGYGWGAFCIRPYQAPPPEPKPVKVKPVKVVEPPQIDYYTGICE